MCYNLYMNTLVLQTKAWCVYSFHLTRKVVLIFKEVTVA